MIANITHLVRLPNLELEAMSLPDGVLSSSYNLRLAVLSIVIAVLASYTALDLTGRVTTAQGRTRRAWWLSGAVAMGIGVWSMHFIAMLAFCLPLPIAYDVPTMLVSLLVAILASSVALHWASSPVLNGLQLLGGGTVMGLAIAAMHYLGMAAMRVQAQIQYDIAWLWLSVAIAIGGSLVALGLAFHLRAEATNCHWQRLVSALVMGVAISGMHYTGMAAASFVPEVQAEGVLPQTLNPTLLGNIVGIGTLLILGLTLLTSLFNRQVSMQRLRAEALRESEERFRTLVENIQVGVLVLGPQQEVLIHNQAALKLLGLDEAQIQNKTAFETDWDLMDENGIRFPPGTSLVAEAINGGQPIRNVVVGLNHATTKERIWLLTNIEPQLAPDGMVEQVVCSFIDLSERKQAEEREALLRLVTEQIRSSLDLPTVLQTVVREVQQLLTTDRVLIYQFSHDWQGEVVVEQVSGNWRSTLGLIGQDDCFSKEYVQLYQGGRVRAVSDILEAGLESCHVEFLQNLQVRANLIVPILIGSKLWGLLIAHECKAPRNWQVPEMRLLQQIANQLAIAIKQAELYDQTRQAAATAVAQAQQLSRVLSDLQQTQAQLIQTEKLSSLGQMVAGIAHEINNPVSFVYGNLSYLNNYAHNLLELLHLYQEHYPRPGLAIQAKTAAIDLDFIVEDLPKILSSMKVGAERIQQIVLSLRNFSRLDQAEMKSVDIHEGLDSTILILQHRLRACAGHSNIEIRKQYSNLPLVECYAGQLNQVFMNILSNAIDALEKHNSQSLGEGLKSEPGLITIQTQAINTNLVTVRIADNGPGMSEAVRARIFDPFFTTKPVGQGTGLGLSISYQIIVKKLGGQLRCSSQPGQGTEFYLELPVRQELSPLPLPLLSSKPWPTHPTALDYASLTDGQ
ncbi:MHYT domain-containing protein [Leptolyngbya sp. FACHB-261]|uniref:MHYT domain-containing protein n=1 Tax=Leptolyngbya sp. FACHB-261 TaxID=2692806 RepID=UPI0016834CC3|nr:MHYT domain-containing protein [Leptolyngbya sp. FACHB-261]MBD2102211.1 GAF domain-containing protein [Leptolyngbya sp. FACHB-261]